MMSIDVGADMLDKRWAPKPADVAAYEQDGFIVAHRLLNDTEVDLFQHAVDAAVAQAWPEDGKLEGYQKVFIQLEQVWRTDVVLRILSLDREIAKAASVLMGTAPIRVYLDQIIFKQPGGLATIAHQDAPFLPFDDSRSVNCWIALDNVTAHNGALEYFRGSHKLGPWRAIELDQPDSLAGYTPELAKFPIERIEVRPGDAVFHNCYVVHRAFPNHTTAPRRAFSIQYMPISAKFNGVRHTFMRGYHPEIGEELDWRLFPIVY
jgi:phytanoyl-CoA hydroxylase